jgi:branched-chain amino acid transport system ATP-binding protein
MQQIGRVLDTVKSKGLTVLLVEQNFRFAANVADRHYVMESGKIIDMITKSEIVSKMGRLEEYLGV